MALRDRNGRYRTGGLMARGLNASVTGNAQAFGFSVTVTVTFGVVSGAQGSPSELELLGFALSSVAAFAVLNVLVAGVARIRRAGRPATRALLIGTATDFLAVGAAVGAAIGIRFGVAGWGLWILAPFAAGICYVLVQSVELARWGCARSRWGTRRHSPATAGLDHDFNIRRIKPISTGEVGGCAG